MDDTELAAEIANCRQRIAQLEAQQAREGFSVKSKRGSKANPLNAALSAEKRHLAALLREEGRRQRARWRKKHDEKPPDDGGVGAELDKHQDGGTPHPDIYQHAEWYGPDDDGMHYWRAEPGWKWLAEESRWVEDASTKDRKPAKPLPLRCTVHGYFAYALAKCPSVGCTAPAVDEFSFTRRSA